MSKLVWDADGQRQFENGVDHGVLYVWDDSAATPGYGKGVAWNGLTSVSESPDGAEPNEIYADNIKYAVLRSAETFGATIEAYTYPDEFEECDGSKALATGVTIGQQTRKKFAFCYRTKIGNDTNEDAGYKLHIVYGCTASPSERQYETINDSPDAITFSWEIDTTPVSFTLNNKTYNTSIVVIDSTKADATKLAALEEKLYGTSEADAELVMPADIYSSTYFGAA